MGTHVFMQGSDCVIIYLSKNKFCVALSKMLFSFFWAEIRFLGYKVGKLIFFSWLCLNFILYK